MNTFRFVRNLKTGKTLIDYALFDRNLGYVLPKLKAGYVELYEGLPGYNHAHDKTRISLIAHQKSAAKYYAKKNTRFD